VLLGNARAMGNVAREGMQPRDTRPAVRIHDGDTVPFQTVEGALDRQRARATSIGLTAAAPPKLAKMLLPGERITFGTAVHPVVLLLPLFYLIVLPLAFSALQWYGRMHAHLWFAEGVWPKVETGIELALLAASLGLLVKRAFRFLSLRIVATNRRIFAIRGVIIRRITPLGNTALAGSTLSQGFFGRMFGYGSIDLPLADGTPDRFRDMRDALQLYREFQAVAIGVDGDDWKPAIRQTIIP
jgi:Bacterial PH domain